MSGQQQNGKGYVAAAMGRITTAAVVAAGGPAASDSARYSTIPRATILKTDAVGGHDGDDDDDDDDGRYSNPGAYGNGPDGDLAPIVTATAVKGVDVGTYPRRAEATAVAAAAATTTTSATFEPMNVEPSGPALVKGTVQEPAYRDRWFAVVFLAHLGAVIAVAAMYGAGTLETTAFAGTDDGPNRARHLIRLLHRTLVQGGGYDSANNYGGEEDATTPTMTSYHSSQQQLEGNEDADADEISAGDEVRFLFTLMVSLVVAPVLSVVAMGYMATNPQKLIQLSLYFAIGWNLLMAVLVGTLATDAIGAVVFHLVLAAVLVCYARAVWHRIPFAAANLKTALTCVRSNMGMAWLGLGGVPLFAGWAILWTYVATSALASPWMKEQEYDVVITDDQVSRSNTHEETGITGPGWLAIVALLLSFYWTWQVIKNVIHTTLAGTVGTWWFTPSEANGCCSRGLTDSLCRSLTYSFGSICFGSLLVAIIEVLKAVLSSMARNRHGGVLRCVAQCLLSWIERIAEYFNKWAFVYVGLYGYSYIDAGRNVFALFAHRGWTALISDALVHRMLWMVSFCIGLINALLAAISTLGVSDSGLILSSALLAFVMGLLLSGMVFGVVATAVDSIIVLFAEAPAELEANHPHLSRELRESWAQAWPDVFSSGPVTTITTSTATVIVIPHAVPAPIAGGSGMV
jgi:hypothetical protein